jgi:hypothetical protein
MLSWAQRTARWTVKTLPFSFGRANGRADGRADGRDVARTTPPETPAEGAEETAPPETAAEGAEVAEGADGAAPAGTPAEGAEGTAPAGTTPTQTPLMQSAPAGQSPAPPENRGSRHRALHERAGAPSARGRHAAPSRSRRSRTSDPG